MKKIIIMIGMLVMPSFWGQNKFLNESYWKAKPDVATVQKDILEGNSPSEMNPAQFDAVTIAINNDAPYETILHLLSQPGNPVSKITHDGRTYLHWAAFRNRIDLVEYLIKGGSDLYVEDTGGRTPFDFGALGGMKKEVFEKFFNAGYPVKKLNVDGANALMAASARDNENLDTTKYLISKGVNPKDKDKQGRTFVDYAARAGNVAVVQSLVKAGYPYTPQILTMAAMGIRSINTLPIFTYLVDTLKVKPTTVDHEGKNVLHYLAGRDNSEEQVAYFLSKGVSISQEDKEKATPVLYAVRNKKTDNIKAFLREKNAGKLLNRTNVLKQNAMMMAAQYSTPEMMELLMKSGVDFTQKDNKGNGILYYIVESYSPRRKESIDFIQQKFSLLKVQNFDFSTPNAEGNTLLHIVAEKDNIDLLKIAMPFGVKVLNAKNTHGNTPLMANAMVAKNTKVLEELKKLGADAKVKNEFGETAYSIASENELLQKNNANISFLK